MTGWELKEPMGALKAAKNLDTKALSNFLEHYTLSCANGDFSILLIFRHFETMIQDDKYRTLNATPNNSLFQKGITVVTLSNGGVSSHNIYLPNKYRYEAISIHGVEITITTQEITKITNIQEINQLFIFDNYSQQQLDDIFLSLNNTYHEPVKKVRPTNTIIKNEFFGELVYDMQLNWYSAEFSSEKDNFEIFIPFSSDEQLKHTIKRASDFLKHKNYNLFLEKMQRDMLPQKNGYWLQEGEHLVTQERFDALVGIDNITFHEDGSSTIDCHDGDLFGGHAIVISVDSNGKYTGSDLAG